MITSVSHTRGARRPVDARAWLVARTAVRSSPDDARARARIGAARIVSAREQDAARETNRRGHARRALKRAHNPHGMHVRTHTRVPTAHTDARTDTTNDRQTGSHKRREGRRAS
eukprot:2321447-Pleurochrysis_carterae.AAC.1